MKSFLIIGMSTFGQHLLKELYNRKCDVFIADVNEEMITPNLIFAASAKIADCTDEQVLKTFGVEEFDACFVCLGGNFSESLEVSSMLKELGARRVITEVNREREKKFLLKNGADEVVYPEEDMAIRMATEESSDSVFDFFELSDGYSVFEIAVPRVWIGKSLKALNIREKHNVNIIAVKSDGHIVPVLSPDRVFAAEEHVILMCHKDNIKYLIK